MTSYLDNFMDDLRAKTADRHAKRAAEAEATVVDPLATLKQNIAEWYRALPPEAHPAYYHMDALVALLKAPPQRLGMALHALGWTRRRVWTVGQPFRQRWFVPEAWRAGSSDAAE